MPVTEKEQYDESHFVMPDYMHPITALCLHRLQNFNFVGASSDKNVKRMNSDGLTTGSYTNPCHDRNRHLTGTI